MLKIGWSVLRFPGACSQCSKCSWHYVHNHKKKKVQGLDEFFVQKLPLSEKHPKFVLRSIGIVNAVHQFWHKCLPQLLEQRFDIFCKSKVSKLKHYSLLAGSAIPISDAVFGAGKCEPSGQLGSPGYV
jgi:hypothetical protein